MDVIKIANFYRANPHSQFPKFEPVLEVDCSELRKAIAKRIGMNEGCDPRELLNTLWNGASVVDVDVDQGLPIQKILQDIEVDSRLFVNWYRFDDIDQFALADFVTHFDAIWYPSSDDIEIFDRTLNWFLLVRHDGLISVWRPP